MNKSKKKTPNKQISSPRISTASETQAFGGLTSDGTTPLAANLVGWPLKRDPAAGRVPLLVSESQIL